jgi:hypothetical protein
MGLVFIHSEHLPFHPKWDKILSKPFSLCLILELNPLMKLNGK